AELGMPRGERLERIEREPQRLAVRGRADGRRAREPVEERKLAEDGPGLDRGRAADGRREPPVEDDVQRAVDVAGANDVLARAKAHPVGVAREAGPVLLRAPAEEDDLIARLRPRRIVEVRPQTLSLGAAASEVNRL